MPTATFNVTKQYMADTGPNGGGAANPGDSHVPLGKWDPGTGLGWVTRALMYAPISFAGMTGINAAYIVLKAHTAAGWHANGSGNKNIRTRRKTGDWSETSGGVSSSVDELWGGDGSYYVVYESTNDHDGDQTFSTDLADGSEVWVNITKIVQAWFAGSPNYGLKLEAASEGSSADAFEFYSRHVSGKVPYIIIDYNDNTAPYAPIYQSPTGDAVVSSTTLAMYHNDPDVGDQATWAEFYLYTDGGTYVSSAGVGPSAGGYWCYWGATGMVSGRRYRWRGRTYDGALWGPYSGYHYFYYEPSQPEPSLSSPVAGVTISTLNPAYQGSENFLGDSSMSHVEIEVRRDSQSGTIIWQSGALADTGSTFSQTGPTLEWGVDYYWRARVRTSLGTWSPWTPYKTFTTQSAGSPQNVQPSGDKLADESAVTISFDADPGDTITRWRFEVFAAGGSSLHLEPWIDNADDTSVSGTFDLSADLSPGGDYEVAVQYEDEVSAVSPWSAKQPFSINAVPAAPTLSSPAQGAVVQTQTPTFVWNFNDPDEGEWGDSQATYTIEVADNDTGLLKATLTGTTAESRTYDDAFTLLWDTTYKWRVQTTDPDGATSAWSGYRTFTPSQPPTVTGVQVASGDLDGEGEISGPTPSVEWTFNSPGSKDQATYRVQAVRTVDENTVYDSGEISGTDTSHTIPNNLLTNGETYRFDVEVTDTDDLDGSGSSSDYTTDFAPPAALAGVLTIADRDASKIRIEWEASSDGEFDHYEVWRRPYGETEWRVLASNIAAINTTGYDDYTAALNQTYEYAVLQVHTLGTGLVAGDYAPVTSALTGVPQWYLVAENREDLTMPLEWAERSADVIPVQQERLEALGRQYKIVVEGNVLGSEGEIEVRIDGTEHHYVGQIEDILRARLDRVLIKAPTGEVYPSKMGSVRRQRGRHGVVVVTFPYVQIEES